MMPTLRGSSMILGRRGRGVYFQTEHFHLCVFELYSWHLWKFDLCGKFFTWVYHTSIKLDMWDIHPDGLLLKVTTNCSSVISLTSRSCKSHLKLSRLAGPGLITRGDIWWGVVELNLDGGCNWPILCLWYLSSSSSSRSSKSPPKPWWGLITRGDS